MVPLQLPYIQVYFQKGLIQCWEPDSSNNLDDINTGFAKRKNLIKKSSLTPIGSFRFAIPLKHIFEFAKDYTKVCYGFDHTLVLTRSSSDNDALFRKEDTVTVATNVPNSVVDLKFIRLLHMQL